MPAAGRRGRYRRIRAEDFEVLEDFTLFGAWCRLLTLLDDEGRALVDDLPGGLRAYFLQLREAGVICLYSAPFDPEKPDSRFMESGPRAKFVHVPNFSEKQKIQRPKPSILPPCPRCEGAASKRAAFGGSERAQSGREVTAPGFQESRDSATKSGLGEPIPGIPQADSAKSSLGSIIGPEGTLKRFLPGLEWVPGLEPLGRCLMNLSRAQREKVRERLHQDPVICLAHAIEVDRFCRKKGLNRRQAIFYARLKDGLLAKLTPADSVVEEAKRIIHRSEVRRRRLAAEAVRKEV